MHANYGHNVGPFRVGLVLQTGQAHMRGVCQGVFRYLHGQPQWRIVGDGTNPLLQWEEVAHWRGEGLIAIANSKPQLDWMVRANVPVVDVGSRFLDPRLTTVAGDNAAIGRLAAMHLLSCGLKRFMFIGELQWENERRRYEAFKSRVELDGHECQLLVLPVNEQVSADASAHYQPDLDQLAEGLVKTDKPVGIFTPSSALTRFVVDVAQDCGFLVPDAVAAIGVNDDPLICESTNPPLTAVMQPSEKIGFEAARQLDLLMRGEAGDPQHQLIAPLGIAARRSTDMLAVEDVDVRSALRYMRENAERPIDVADVAIGVAVSRRTLETKFRRELGRTPAQELRRVRIERAKSLLSETSNSITNVVFGAGFNSRQAFCSIFRRETGMTPSQYREQFRMSTLG